MKNKKIQADHGPEGDEKFFQESVAKAIEARSPYKTEIYEEEMSIWPDGQMEEYGYIAIYVSGIQDIGSHYAGVYTSSYFDEAMPEKEIADVEIFVDKEGQVEDQNPGGPSDIDFGVDALIERIDAVYSKYRNKHEEVESSYSDNALTREDDNDPLTSKLENSWQDIHEYLYYWYDNEGYSDLNLMLDKGLTKLACYHMAGTGAIGGGDNESIENDILMVDKNYSSEERDKDYEEFFENVEVWINDDSNEHWFFDETITFKPTEEELESWGFRFDSKYDENGKMIKSAENSEAEGEKSCGYVDLEKTDRLIEKILDGVNDPEGIDTVYKLKDVLESGAFNFEEEVENLIEKVLDYTNDPEAIDTVYELQKEYKQGKKLMPLREDMVMEQLEAISDNIDVYVNDQYPNEFLFDYDLREYPEESLSDEESRELNGLLTDVADKMEFETLHPTGASGGSDHPYTSFVVKLHAEDKKVVEEAKMFHDAVQEALKAKNYAGASIAPYFANNPEFKSIDNYQRFQPDNNKKLADEGSKDYLDDMSDLSSEEPFKEYVEEYKEQIDEGYEYEDEYEEDIFEDLELSDEDIEMMDEDDLMYIMDEGGIDLDIKDNLNMEEEGEALSNSDEFKKDGILTIRRMGPDRMYCIRDKDDNGIFVLKDQNIDNLKLGDNVKYHINENDEAVDLAVANMLPSFDLDKVVELLLNDPDMNEIVEDSGIEGEFLGNMIREILLGKYNQPLNPMQRTEVLDAYKKAYNEKNA